MTSVTVQLEEALFAKTRAIAEMRHATVDEVVPEALQNVAKNSTFGETEESTEADCAVLTRR
jgi:predicted transcriptional regulator